MSSHKLSLQGLTLVHGAGGNLGGLIIDALLKRGADAKQIVAGVRDKNSEGAKKLEAKGVQLRVADYNSKDNLVVQYKDVHTVVFIPVPTSSIERAQSAENSISAAVQAGVKRYVQLSWGRGTVHSVDSLVPGYLFAEARLRTSGIHHYTIIRNGQWFENAQGAMQGALATGVFARAIDPEARGAYIHRPDTAKAIAVAVLRHDLHEKTLQLDNNVAVNANEIAAALSEISGKKIVAKQISVDDLAAVLKANLPEAMKPASRFIAQIYRDIDHGVEKGENTISNDYFALTGESPTPLKDVLRELAGLKK